MKLIQLAYGIATFLPGFSDFRIRKTGGTDSARYCYSVWLRHLVMAKNNGLNPNPKVVAELGPGDSIGIGLAALLSGAQKYFAFDVVEHASLEGNLDVLEQLVALFKKKIDIPDDKEFPRIKPYLEDYSFPYDILTDDRLEQALEENRIEQLRNSIRNPRSEKSMIDYRASWYDKSAIQKNTVDIIFSQAVLEHVDDLDHTYESMYLWMKDDGFMSHQIDFKCHGTAKQWNGHWTYSDVMWKLIKGKRPYLLNREPLSTHLEMLGKKKLKVVFKKPILSTSGIGRDQLARRFRHFSDEDLTTSGVFIQAHK